MYTSYVIRKETENPCETCHIVKSQLIDQSLSDLQYGFIYDSCILH